MTTIDVITVYFGLMSEQASDIVIFYRGEEKKKRLHCLLLYQPSFLCLSQAACWRSQQHSTVLVNTFYKYPRLNGKWCRLLGKFAGEVALFKGEIKSASK